MTDEWKIISEFSKYECNKMGQVRNVTSKQIQKGNKREKGYIYYTLRDTSGKSFTKSGHRLIAITWIPNPNKKPSVDHINRIRNDNRVENLRWSTHKEQSANMVRKKEINKNKGVWQCNLETNERIKFYRTCNEAAAAVSTLSSAHTSIAQAARGTRKSAFGFKWEYDTTKNKDLNGEEWKFYLNVNKKKYYVSNLGRVKLNNDVLNGSENDGYRTVKINDKEMRVHIIVAELFIENPNKHPQVNHKDGNRSNNAVNNLEWITASENTIHAINTGLRKNIKKIVNYDSNGTILKVYNSAREAARELHIDYIAILKYCNGSTPRFKNRTLFKFLDSNDNLKDMKIILTK